MTTNPFLVLGSYTQENVPRDAISFSKSKSDSFIPKSLLVKEGVFSRGEVESRVIREIGTKNLYNYLEDDISLHMESRLQIMFQQMVLVYKTNLVFKNYFRADFQLGQASDKEVGSTINGIPFVGAHNALFSTLRVLSEKFAETGFSFSIAANTYIGKRWNGTVYLPKLVNDCDGQIERSLRQEVLNILNQVSGGDLNPKEGFINFLSLLRETLNSDSGSHAKDASIFSNYLSVVNFYWSNLNKNSDLLRKICLVGVKEILTDEVFFKKAQKEQHKLIKKELEQKKTDSNSNFELSQDVDYRHWRDYFVKELPDVTSKAAENYVKRCGVNEAVISAAKAVIEALHQISLTEERKDDEGMPPQELPEYDSLKMAVKNTLVKNIQNQSYVISGVLLKICHELWASNVIFREPRRSRRNELYNKIITCIQTNRLELFDPTKSNALSTHVKKCSSEDSVKTTAEELFKQLCDSPRKLQNIEIASFVDITEATFNNKKRFMVASAAFYGAISATLFSRDKTVQKVGTICLNLLASLNQFA